jgi:hypothetical protein
MQRAMTVNERSQQQRPAHTRPRTTRYCCYSLLTTYYLLAHLQLHIVGRQRLHSDPARLAPIEQTNRYQARASLAPPFTLAIERPDSGTITITATMVPKTKSASNPAPPPPPPAMQPQHTGSSIKSERSFHSSKGHQTPALSRRSSVANTKIDTSQIGVPLVKEDGGNGTAGNRPRMHKRSLTGEIGFLIKGPLVSHSDA